MPTRANIIIKDNQDKLFFYRHSDGYPEGTMPTLNIFMDWVKTGKIRNNVQQAAGWLVLLGAMEYATIPDYTAKEVTPFTGYTYKEVDVKTITAPSDWKASAYEPTTAIHGDIEYLYIIDLQAKEIKCYDSWTPKGEPKGKPVTI